MSIVTLSHQQITWRELKKKIFQMLFEMRNLYSCFQHFDIRYADPQTSRLYSEELDRQFLQKQFERFEREVKTHRDEREV